VEQFEYMERLLNPRLR